MAIEIERKFKVVGLPWTTHDVPINITQGYISLDSGRAVRVRIEDTPTSNTATLTVKGEPIDISRTEFEYKIPYDDAVQMLNNGMCVGKLRKRRYIITYFENIWTVDEYLGNCSGLILAEIELANPDAQWIRPPWLGEEVTHDINYFNSRLTVQPRNE